MRVDANMNVSCIDAVALGVRERDKEGQNAKHGDYQSNDKQSFHQRLFFLRVSVSPW